MSGIKKVKISDVTKIAESLEGIISLGVDGNNDSVQIPLHLVGDALVAVQQLEELTEQHANDAETSNQQSAAARNQSLEGAGVSIQKASEAFNDANNARGYMNIALEAKDTSVQALAGNVQIKGEIVALKNQVIDEHQATENAKTVVVEAKTVVLQAKEETLAAAQVIAKRVYDEAAPLIDEAVQVAVTAKNDTLQAKSEVLTAKQSIDASVLAVSQMKTQVEAEIANLTNSEVFQQIDDTLATKIDGAYSEDGKLYLTIGGVVVGEGIDVGTGTGGGGVSDGTSVIIRVTSGFTTTFAAAEGAEALLHYTFNSVYTSDNSQTGPGLATLFVGDVQVLAQTIAQGDGVINVGSYLKTGSNSVSLIIADSLGTSRTIKFTVNVVSISITSSFDDSIAYTEAMTIKFTPIGSLEKTIRFFVDDVEIGNVVTSLTNRQLSFAIPAQSHGEHIIEAFAEATVGGVLVKSNVLRYAAICIEAGNDTPIIASPFKLDTIVQYGTLNIPYIVYTPSLVNSTISIFANDEKTADLVVDKLRHNYVYRTKAEGQLSIRISCGAVSKSFQLNVSGSAVTSKAETADLELFLTSAGRSNNEPTTKNVWKYGDIQAVMTNFNFVTDGWITDEDGNTALRVSGDARVVIPLKIFSNDFRTSGKTIEFEIATRNINDFYTSPITSMSGGIGMNVKVQEAKLSTEQSYIVSKFKENERVRISYVIEKKTDNCLLMIYINGILSSVKVYQLTDNFIQFTNPSDIYIGTNGCTTDIYNIRVYNNNLTNFQILDNYIADMDDVDQKLELFNRNQVFDEYGTLIYASVLAQLPCMIITGKLPTYKGDKQNIDIVYQDQQVPTNSFTLTRKTGNTNIDVQGTSSQYYPRKNYKISLGKGTLVQNGATVTKSLYKLRPTSIAVPTFTMKADFAESSGTHNTGLAILADSILKGMGYLTPPQITNSAVRTTVDGFPIVIFHRTTIADTPTFLGKYNFNIDKGSTAAFGFNDAAIQESWEFMNNTAPRCLFRKSEWETIVFDITTQANKLEWLYDFEPRWPDVSPMYSNSTNLKILFDFILNNDPDAATGVTLGTPVVISGKTYTTDSAAYRIARFKNEFSAHFNKNNILSYYLITELFGMVDQRAKNQFLTSWGNEGSGDYKWYMILYDNDTCLGINNEGVNQFNYDIEYHDPNVWNGESSLLWTLVEKAFASELVVMYQDMRSAGVISYETTMHVLNDLQALRWSEALYNMDARFKYIEPYVLEGKDYLFAAQGSRTEHRKWWLYNRFRYIDSKYIAGDYKSDFITMRLYTPLEEVAVPANHSFLIVPFSDQYTRVKFGSYLVGQRSYAATPVTITPPAMTFNDTETIIYGASHITAIGVLYDKYAGTIDLSMATHLTEVLIGTAIEGYDNPHLWSLTLGNNLMLKKLDIQNCSGLDAPLNIAGCLNIDEVYAKGSAITSVILPNAGNLKVLQLPATMTNLTIKNQPQLNGLTLEGLQNLIVLRIENCPLIDTQAILEDCLSLETVALSRVRLLDIDWTLEDATFLYAVRDLHGLDEYDNIVPNAVITGRITINSEMTLTEFDTLAQLLPEVEFIVPNLLDYSYEITGASSINGMANYHLNVSEIDLGLHTEERIVASWEVIQNSESVTLVAEDGDMDILLMTKPGVYENPEGGVVLKATSIYDESKTALFNIDLSGFVQNLTISGAGSLGETEEETYAVEYNPTDTFQTGVEWSIDGSPAFATIDSASGLVSVIDGVMSASQQITIRATSTKNSNVSATKTVSVIHTYTKTFNFSFNDAVDQGSPFIVLSNGTRYEDDDHDNVISFRTNSALVGTIGATNSVSQELNMPALASNETFQITLDEIHEVSLAFTYDDLGSQINRVVEVTIDGVITSYDPSDALIVIRTNSSGTGVAYADKSAPTPFSWGATATDKVINVHVSKVAAASITFTMIGGAVPTTGTVVVDGVTYNMDANGNVIIYSNNLISGVAYATNAVSEPFSIPARTADTSYNVDMLFTVITTWSSTVVETIMKTSFDYYNNDIITAEGLSHYTTLGTAFSNKDTLLNFPELAYFRGMTYLTNSAFSSDHYLVSVKLPKTLLTIGNSAFQYCTRLTGITIPEGVTEIKDSAFQYDASLNNVILPSTLQKIGYNAFSEVHGWNVRVLPASMTTTGGNIFYNCLNVTTVDFSATKITTINANDCGNCPKLSSISLPPNVTTINGNWAQNTIITSIDLPASAVTLYSGAFENLLSLTSINAHPNNASYASVDGVLYNKALTTLAIWPSGKPVSSFTTPAGVTAIGNYAFSKNKNITEVIFSSELRTIGAYAFQECSSITNLTIPSTVTSVGLWAFSICSGIQNLNILANITSITSAMFQGLTALRTLTLPPTLTTIQDGAITSSGTYPITVAIPASLTSVTAKGLALFGATSFTVDSANTALSGDGVAIYNKNATAIKIFPRGRTGAYTALSSITSVALSCFQSSKLTTLNLPNGVLSIEDSGMSDMSNMTSFTIPSSLTTLGSYAFSNCKFTSAGFTSLVSMGSYAFSSASVTSCYLPSTVTTLGSGILSFATSCARLTVDTNSVPTIGSSWYPSQGSFKVIVKSSLLYSFKVATNWSAAQAKIIGIRLFYQGEAFPNLTQGIYTVCTWYSDEACTQVVTGTAPSASSYYCKLT